MDKKNKTILRSRKMKDVARNLFIDSFMVSSNIIETVTELSDSESESLLLKFFLQERLIVGAVKNHLNKNNNDYIQQYIQQYIQNDDYKNYSEYYFRNLPEPQMIRLKNIQEQLQKQLQQVEQKLQQELQQELQQDLQQVLQQAEQAIGQEQISKIKQLLLQQQPQQQQKPFYLHISKIILRLLQSLQYELITTQQVYELFQEQEGNQELITLLKNFIQSIIFPLNNYFPFNDIINDEPLVIFIFIYPIIITPFFTRIITTRFRKITTTITK